MGSLRAELITDPPSLASVEDRWRELAVERANAFVTPEWFHSWWTCQGADSSPLIAVCRRPDESIAGVMPLVLDETSRPRAVRFAGASIGDRFHPAAAAAEETAVAQATMAALEAEGFESRMLLFEHADSDSDWWRLMGRRSAVDRVVVEQQQTEALFIDLRGLDWENYLALRSKKFRKQIRRSERAIEARSMNLRSSDAKTLGGDLETLFRLHDLRRAGLGGSSLHAAARSSLTRFAVAAEARGWLRLAVLEADETPVAAFLGWRLGDTFASYQGGFDPAWAKQSVGFGIEAMMIRAAIEEGAAEYDFLLGTEAWKRRFTNACRPSQTAVLLRARRPIRVLVAGEARLRRVAGGIHRRPALARLVRSMHGLIPTARRS